jgi:hypothetical protein
MPFNLYSAYDDEYFMYNPFGRKIIMENTALSAQSQVDASFNREQKADKLFGEFLCRCSELLSDAANYNFPITENKIQPGNHLTEYGWKNFKKQNF